MTSIVRSPVAEAMASTGTPGGCVRMLAAYVFAEARAVRNAVAILQVEGSTLGFPWSSAVRGGDGLRELRPRRGRSPWRVLYRRSPSGLELLALAPEAGADRRAFDRALARAAARARDRDRGK